MKLLQFVEPASGQQHLGIIEGEEVVDLSDNDGPGSVYDVYYGMGGNETGLEAALGVALARVDGSKAGRLNLAALLAAREGDGNPYLVKPVSGPRGDRHALRIWLAGVTHEDSAKLREIEAKQATGSQVNVYEQKYRECAEGGRPELFSKGEPNAVVGHGQPLTRPADTVRLVPETEVVSVYGLNKNGQVERLGYTGGNDGTDNGIEAANPLNLPQAKNWAAGCASLGPVLVTTSDFDDSDVTVSCEVLRNGEAVGFKEGKTGQDHLNMPDGLFHMERSLLSRLPLEAGELLALYWGTPLVFAEADFAGGLLVGDLVRMTFSGGIGVLENEVVALGVTDQLAGLDQR